MTCPVLHEAVDADLEDLRAHGFELPRTAVAYCADWLAAGYLVRRPGESREEHYELSDGALAAIRFVEELTDPRPSVTESRLATIVERIHRLAVDTDPDVTRRIAALTAERDRIDAQIAALAAGDVDELPEERAVERAIDILSLAAEIPEDFARVRTSLGQLNRDLRRQLVEEPGSRGTVLEDVFRGSTSSRTPTPADPSPRSMPSCSTPRARRPSRTRWTSSSGADSPDGSPASRPAHCLACWPTCRMPAATSTRS